ncbi:MAG TPA: prolyl oligopeptidase family serine peptidase, partial [Roseiflexaceae bacterium]
MPDPVVAPYGAWRSPITPDAVVAGATRLGELAIDGDEIYWSEGRPAEGGRTVAVRRASDGRMSALTPVGFNVRSRVHEYGGGAFTVASGTLYFSNFDDGRVYRQDPGAAPQPISPEAALRYADFALDARRGRLICVREDHREPGCEAVNTLASLDLDGVREGQVLVSGGDFYSSPRLSPDGARLCWLAWNHPNMPWDGAELWVADLNDDGSLSARTRIAGGVDESIFQPEWSPDGVLHFVSDRTGWWNLYRWRGGRAEPLHAMEAEFGLPQWVFGMSTYCFEPGGRIICAYTAGGVSHMASLDAATGAFEPIDLPYTLVEGLRAGAGQVVFVGGSPAEPPAVVRLDLADRVGEVLRRSSEAIVDAGYISTPEPIEFPTAGGLTAHAFFYQSRNPDFSAPPGDRPPLLVIIHGGPTGAADVVFSPEVLFWTSRGFAVVDVNYGGSTGYGRAYRERLAGRWGVVDVEDCAGAARFLADRGDVDRARLAIRGGSAGGYTTLCALTFRDEFRAGASYYGIGDLEVLARDTHKFESRYLDRLIGPYPERKDLYYERSPIHFTDRLTCPVIVLQG